MKNENIIAQLVVVEIYLWFCDNNWISFNFDMNSSMNLIKLNSNKSCKWPLKIAYI